MHPTPSISSNARSERPANPPSNIPTPISGAIKAVYIPAAAQLTTSNDVTKNAHPSTLMHFDEPTKSWIASGGAMGDLPEHKPWPIIDFSNKNLPKSIAKEENRLSALGKLWDESQLWSTQKLTPSLHAKLETLHTALHDLTAFLAYRAENPRPKGSIFQRLQQTHPDEMRTVCKNKCIQTLHDAFNQIEEDHQKAEQLTEKNEQTDNEKKFIASSTYAYKEIFSLFIALDEGMKNLNML